MQHASRPDDHGEAERDEAIDAADREATDKELDELRATHRMFRSLVHHCPTIVGIPPIELKIAKIRSCEKPILISSAAVAALVSDIMPVSSARLVTMKDRRNIFLGPIGFRSLGVGARLEVSAVISVFQTGFACCNARNR